MKKGLFITFEGSEGCGKSTQLALLCERLRDLGKQVVCVREPGGTNLGEAIRTTFKHGPDMTGLAELCLISASRVELLAQVIRPALAEGRIVLCDRFYDSTVAYQGCGRGVPMESVLAVIRATVSGTDPDRTFLLDVPLDVSMKRIGHRSQDRIEKAGRAFFERVNTGFFMQARAQTGRIFAIDGTGEREAISQVIWERVQEILE